MNKKIYISPSNQVGNTYATGNTNEREQCHRIAKACVDTLNENGFQVMCTYNDDMYKRVKESNAFGADMHIAIHTNATAKHNVTGGTQILLYALDGERMKAGVAVFDRLSPLTPGKSAERIIAKPGFYECKAANGITVYVEAEFHDTTEGSDFIINNTKKIGEAIAKGICDYYGVKETIKMPKDNRFSVKEWQDAAIKDGFEFPLFGADNKWGAECEGVATIAVCRNRGEDDYRYENLTRLIQQRLGFEGEALDGLFGADTEEAVRKYQQIHNLEADGKVGINTWKSMLGV